MAEQNFPDNVLYELDNLDVLRGMNSETVDLIATDPPFNTRRNRAGTAGFYVDNWKWGDTGKLPDQWAWNEVHPVWMEQIKDDNRALYEVINAARACHGEDIAAFLCFLSVRLLEMRRVLKPTGSIYLHCDHTANGYIRMAMDAVFGARNFRNEIAWCYTGPGSPGMRQFNRKHDTIFWYAKGARWTFNSNEVRIPHKRLNTNTRGAMITAPLTPEDRESYLAKGKVPESWWPEFSPVGRIASERTGSPDQKPLALYERIILASSKPGDLVLDPFAGCATTIIAAKEHGRRWVGIDRRKDARFHVVTRMMGMKAADAEKIRKERPDLNRWLNGRLKTYDAQYRTEAPERTDDGAPAAPLLPPVFFPMRGETPPWQRLRHEEMQGILNRIQSAANDDALVVCAGCGRDLERPFMELDHIIPRADGGENYITNRVMLCRPCNGRKRQNLTLSGLRTENRREGWMKDAAKAESTALAVGEQTRRIRDAWASADVQTLVHSVQAP